MEPGNEKLTINDPIFMGGTQEEITKAILATMPEPKQKSYTYEEAEKLWGEKIKIFSPFLRNFVSNRIVAENDLEELGTSDVNCYAVGYIRSGLLNLDTIPYWTDGWDNQ